MRLRSWTDLSFCRHPRLAEKDFGVGGLDRPAGDLEAPSQRKIDCRAANQDLDRAWLDCITQRPVVEAELMAVQRKTQLLALARIQADTLEALQFLDGPGHAGIGVADVELHDLVSSPAAGVGHADADGYLRR